MSNTRGTSALLAYGLAFASVGSALVLAILLLHFDSPLPFAAFALSAIALTFWYGGTEPGVLAVVLSTLVRSYFFRPEITVVSRILYDSAFLIFALAMIWLTRARSELEVKVAERTAELSRANEELQREIAERKRAEGRLRLALDTTPALIHSGRPDGYLDFFNQRWLDYVGCSLEALAGWKWTAVIHPEDVEGVVTKWRASLARGEPFEVEARVRRADGVYRWMLHRKVPLREEHGNIVKWYGTSSDIEDLKGAEDRIRLIIETIPTMAWSLRPDGALDFINKRWLDYTGLSLEQEIKEPGRPVHPEDLPRVMEKWLADLAAGEPNEDEIRLRRADGEYRWFLVRNAPLRDEYGNIVKWYGTSSDIEDLKRTEDRIRLIIDTIPMMAWSVRTDGVVDFLNKRWMDYTGLSLEDYVEEPTRPIHPDDVPRAIEKWLANTAVGEPYEDEMRLRRADGEYRWFLVRTAPLRDEQGNVVKWYGLSIDIEDRKRAEEERRLGETYLAMAQRIARMGVWSWKPSGGDMFGSEEFYRIFGIEPDKAKLTREVFLQRIHPEDRPAYESEINAAVAERRNWESDYRIVLPDASVKYVHAIGKATFDKSGDILEFVGTVLDITERKRAEEELRQAEEHIRAILEYSPNWIFLKDMEGRYLLVNREIERVFGISQEQIKGKMDSEIFPPQQAAEYRANDLKVLRAGLAMEFEEIALLGDGPHTSIVHKFPLFDIRGDIYATGGVATDITERVRAEEELRRIRERLESVLNSVSDTFILFDRQWRYLYLNDAALRATRRPLKVIMARTVWDLFPDVVGTELDHKFHRAMDERVHVEFDFHLVELGNDQWWQIRAYPASEGLAVFSTEITERKRADEELRRLSVELLRSQDEERRRIARDLHDSTGQNLVALATMLGQLRSSVGSGEQKTRRLLSECQALADQCIREVRTLSYVLHPPVLDEAGIEDAIREYVKGFTQRSGIKVKLELSARLGRMSRDVELALFRVMQESLTNVQRHSGSLQAKIRLGRNGANVIMEVGDSGRGAPETVGKTDGEIPFQRGVGITSMQERVRLIGGVLEVAQTHRGTTIRVVIPVGD